MSDEYQKTTELLETLMIAEREIAAAAGDSYRLYECLHRVADRIACADAFYICLYSEADRSLYFPYNYDNGVYDFPSTYPLGSGPTSQVILRNEPFVWSTAQESHEVRGIHFGDLETSTASAVHMPIRKPGAGPEEPLLGVLSAHSYQPGVYGPLEIRLYQWLADRAGVALLRTQTKLLNTERQQQAAWMADEFVQMVSRITQDAQALHALLPADPPALRQASSALMQSCYRSQTEANQLPLRTPGQPLPPPPIPTPPAPSALLSLLTDREREILGLLATGHTNGEIAKSLFISTNTIKDHLKRIYAKLGVSSRYQAIQKFQASSA